MTSFILWCILFVVCWPLALIALVAYPFVWLICLPFRLIGFAVEGIFEVIGNIVSLPFRMMNKLLGK